MTHPQQAGIAESCAAPSEFATVHGLKFIQFVQFVQIDWSLTVACRQMVAIVRVEFR
jgi:hypothetical protein